MYWGKTERIWAFFFKGNILNVGVVRNVLENVDTVGVCNRLVKC